MFLDSATDGRVRLRLLRAGCVMIGYATAVVRGAWRRAARVVATRAAKYAGIPLRDPALVAMLGTQPSSAGVDVDEHTALNCSAVWQAVSLIAANIAAMPAQPHEVRDGAWVPAVDRPESYLLSVCPNDEMTPFTLVETMQAHALVWGNGYAELEREGEWGPVTAIEPLLPNQVTPKRDSDGYIQYEYNPDEGEERRDIPANRMLHIPGLGFDGLKGYGVIQMAREAVGMSLATEKYGAAFFGRGSVPGGLLEVPDGLEMTDKARRNLRESFELLHRGPDNAHRIGILEQGVQYKPLSLPPDQAQFLQTRLFQIQEIARWFNIPPHLLRDLTHATFSNIEHQGLDFLIYTLRPWLLRWQQEYRRKLWGPAERLKYGVDHDVSNLLLTDVNARYDAYGKGRNGGWLTLNDILRKERQPTLPPELGDTRLAPSTMNVLGAADPSKPIDVATIAAVTEYLRSLKPLSADLAKTVLTASIPSATPQLVLGLVNQLIREHVVEG